MEVTWQSSRLWLAHDSKRGYSWRVLFLIFVWIQALRYPRLASNLLCKLKMTLNISLPSKCWIPLCTKLSSPHQHFCPSQRPSTRLQINTSVLAWHTQAPALKSQKKKKSATKSLDPRSVLPSLIPSPFHSQTCPSLSAQAVFLLLFSLPTTPQPTAICFLPHLALK